MHAKRSFFLTTSGKIGNASLSKEIPCPNGLETSFINSATSIREVLPRWNLWWTHYASTGSFAPTSNHFRWFLHGICLFGQKRLASICSSFLVCASIAAYSINVTVTLNLRMFAHVIRMCKRSNIFYEHNIKFVFAHVNHQHVQA